MSAAIVRSAWSPVRAEPSHRAEMVTQWVCGEVLRTSEEADSWIETRGPDGYSGWSPVGSLRLVDSEGTAEWEARATAWSLGTALEVTADRSGAAAAANHLPWGSRVELFSDGTVELPDGRSARPVRADALVRSEELPGLFPRDGPSVVETARRWLGAPYLWGGRTEAGVDCSGLVQATFAVHGVQLPRDSSEQAESGARLELGAGMPTDPSPGDLVFFAPEGRGITHVGILVDEIRLLHASASNGCVAVDDLSGDRTLARLLRESIVAWTRPLGPG